MHRSPFPAGAGGRSGPGGPWLDEPLAQLHRRYHDSRDAALRNWLVQRYSGLARALAVRAAKPGDDLDDLVQVASLGVLYALERFDPARGVEFTTFAWATVQGELKRHHRDRGWMVHVPRRLQEAYLRVAAAVDELNQRLGRPPTLQEIASLTGDDEETVIEAIEVRAARRPASIDVGVGEDRDLPWDPGAEDLRLAAVDERGVLESLLPRLSRIERDILRLRFVDNLTQADIADRVGYSQMHISRMLARTLVRLRQWAETDARAVDRPVAVP